MRIEELHENLNFHVLLTNGWFCIIKKDATPTKYDPHGRVMVLNRMTGEVSTKKLYLSSKGEYFKGGNCGYGKSSHYLHKFDKQCFYVPFQIVEIDQRKVDNINEAMLKGSSLIENTLYDSCSTTRSV